MLDSVLLSVVLGVTMKATLVLCFALLSCVSLLVGAKSIKSKHGKISFVTAGVKRIWHELFVFVSVEELRLHQLITLND